MIPRRRGRFVQDEPETRIGNCCGCSRLIMLYKIAGIFRYRCSECYQREVGRRHHLDISLEPHKLVTEREQIDLSNIGSEDDSFDLLPADRC